MKEQFAREFQSGHRSLQPLYNANVHALTHDSGGGLALMRNSHIMPAALGAKKCMSSEQAQANHFLDCSARHRLSIQVGRPTGFPGPLSITLIHKDRTSASLVSLPAIRSGSLVPCSAMWIPNLRSRQGRPRGLRVRVPRLDSGGPRHHFTSNEVDGHIYRMIFGKSWRSPSVLVLTSSPHLLPE